METETEKWGWQRWGWHLSVDASNCDLDKMTSRENVYNFTKRLVKDIDMEAYGEPEIVYFGQGDKSGYTMQQLISTSNICAHFVDEYKAIFLDVFSCKPYDEKIVIDLMKEYFSCRDVNTRMITRDCLVLT
jgi:S-adenosylmethionine/arginine decarboxylase-like enzyme